MLDFACRRSFDVASGGEIAMEEWLVLRRVQRDPGITVSDLARKSRRDPTTTTRMLDRLVKKELLERRADLRDRRRLRLFLTRPGYETAARMQAVTDQLEQHLREVLSPSSEREIGRAIEVLLGGPD